MELNDWHPADIIAGIKKSGTSLLDDLKMFPADMISEIGYQPIRHTTSPQTL